MFNEKYFHRFLFQIWKKQFTESATKLLATFLFHKQFPSTEPTIACPEIQETTLFITKNFFQLKLVHKISNYLNKKWMQFQGFNILDVFQFHFPFFLFEE